MFLAAINLILDLKCYDVRPMLLSGLVALLRPSKEEVEQYQNMKGNTLVIKCSKIFLFFLFFLQRLIKYSSSHF